VEVDLGDSSDSGQGPVITETIEPVRFFLGGISSQNEGEFMFLHGGVLSLVSSYPYPSPITVAGTKCEDSGRRRGGCHEHGFQDSAVST
jgi:hypothetical protein